MRLLHSLLTTVLLSSLLVACGPAEPAVDEEVADDHATVTEQDNTDRPQPTAVSLNTTTDYTDGLQLGEVAPDFSLRSIDGKTYSMADFKDANGNTPKGYIVAFTCNTCPYAVAYEDRLIELHNKMAAQGYPVIAIMPNDIEVKPDDDFAAMQKRAMEKNFPFAYLDDAAQEVYPLYGATRTPEIYLLDADRVLRYTGAIDDNYQDPDGVTVNYVEQAIAAIERGETPDPAKVKAIGCTIKTKKG